MVSEAGKAVVGSGSLDDMPLGLAASATSIALVALSGAVHLYEVAKGADGGCSLGAVGAVLRGPQAAVTTLCVDAAAGAVYYAGAAGTVCVAPLFAGDGGKVMQPFVGGGGGVKAVKLGAGVLAAFALPAGRNLLHYYFLKFFANFQ